MNYDGFKEAWDVALKESKLRMFAVAPTVTIDLRTLSRTYEVCVEPLGGQDANPFLVTAAFSWRWDALKTARTRSTEEDLLVELLGRDDGDAETARPWLRVDITFCATLPYDKPLAMPPPSVWAAWTKEVQVRLEYVEPMVPDESVREQEDGRLAILAWKGEPEARFVCGAGGALKLERVEVACWQAIELPRQWDDPEREADPHPHLQLTQMFSRVKAGLHAWMEITDHLRRADR